jgi:hypothetical protein
MGSTGLENGRKISGLMPGIKSGRGLSPMRSGKSSGLSNGIMNHRNMQDPILLIGAKSPMIYWNAESCIVNASNNVLTVNNLITTSVETLSVTSDPNRVTGSVYNGKSGIAFDSTDFISSTLFFSKAEASVIVVVRPDATGGQFIINSIWTTFSDTVGDFTLVSNGGTITANFIGNPNTTDCTITSYPLSTTDYHIVTLKLRLTKNGGDSMEMFVNGNKQSNYTVSNFTAGVGFQASVPMLFGGNSSQTLGGNAIGSALVFNYFLENHEQLRLENYLRWYYGRNF